MKDLLPIIKSLKSNLSASLLFILQVAITFTILVNAIFLAMDKRQSIGRASGLDEQNVFYIATNLPVEEDERASMLDQDLANLNALSGVEYASVSSGVPLSGWGRFLEVATEPDARYDTFSGYYGGDLNLFNAFGVKLVAGSEFSPSSELRARTDGHKVAIDIMITKSLAESLYAEQWEQVVGKTIYIDKKPQRVVGVIDKLQAAWPTWVVVEHVILGPVKEADAMVYYIVRTQLGQQSEVMESALAYLMSFHGRKIDKIETFEQVKANAYSAENAASNTLFGVIGGLLVVTALGIFGQSRYSIIKRTKLIGIRRAMGASKGQIIRYFVLENFVLCSIGIAIGIVSAIVLSNAFSNAFSLGTVPVHYMFYGTLCTILLGQIAVLYPALKASQLSPAIATRTV
ncbi:ABC transporter permease [Pseudoalteromonas luteoviolacea]|uniref:ABC transporter permease n=1 Tax=Pseudoalteromonas luteoviolacea TaxID=43657 RepID=UPI001F40102C|nr:FtsX-like permease family protein [Pseudoalteromonas luteoviolacea]MCF6439164.1 ABC transporter permease [Pseudoalteromonas luteoviolacea]